ncbi:formate dehydrogenase subunit delta [Aliirhizobium terrae]|uniref:formate dehydrogenase subunit delta n=1 Tax=Terrirhizobium terrae TaxID=2926709 RepID=UPI00257732B5|nr:formate dehydrogenase subunit delta [Rhizobium sp. CC-CFT758]WJH41304.1 formate dehydrogenase subunit delta [Rhizobium sp. CC-CFT758]
MSHEPGQDDGHDKGQDKLIRMANQIATFFMSQPEKVRTEGVATHINKFWEPRMRRHLFEHLDRGGEGLMPLVVEASALIKRPPAPAPIGVAGGDSKPAELATPQN